MMYSDSDYAGCISSTTQGVLSLSTGEAEFYAAVKATSIGMGMTEMLKDMGVHATEALTVHVDATAGLGIASRRGAGRIRHIACPALWLQQAVQDGRVRLRKVAGAKNPADLGTKFVDRATILRALNQCGFVALSGRSQQSLRAEVAA